MHAEESVRRLQLSKGLVYEGYKTNVRLAMYGEEPCSGHSDARGLFVLDEN